MTRRGPGPHVVWAGVVVKLDDGTSHAVEFTSGFITADLKLPHLSAVRPEMYSDDLSIWLRGRGRYWAEGANMDHSKVEPRAIEPTRREIERNDE